MPESWLCCGRVAGVAVCVQGFVPPPPLHAKLASALCWAMGAVCVSCKAVIPFKTQSDREPGKMYQCLHQCHA
jgi:hypothetical protein